MKKLACLFLFVCPGAFAQIPESGYAVISADSVYELEVSGVQRINTIYPAHINDRFHIGSNTKAVTAYIASRLVRQGTLQWDTHFFSLFPALKKQSRKVYHDITLGELLTFRGKLPGYTYTYATPTNATIKDRYELAAYFLRQAPMAPVNGLTPSNADYVLAGLMLEKASGKSYKDLVRALGFNFDFDYPNLHDTLQPWGHDVDMNPVPPGEQYKMNWLLSAGNLNISLPDYIRFIQVMMKEEELLFGKPGFAYGWFNDGHIAWNEGNAGAFITQVRIDRDKKRAYIIFTNAASEKTHEAVNKLMMKLVANMR
jgi:CubicO group peptidase (beta-lactamase class C family)